jgi:glc operon protein GlcG
MQQKWILGAEDIMRVAEASRTVAAREGWAVSIAVVDAAGDLLHFQRLGARVSTIEVAIAKARTAAFTLAPSAAFEQRARDNPNFLALREYMPLQGGVPLMYRGECVGAVGVSGVKAEQDEQVARAGSDTLGALA